MSVSQCFKVFQSFQVKHLKVFQGETPVKRCKYIYISVLGAFLHCFTVSCFSVKHL